MSAGQVIGTAAAVVGVGVAGAVGWKIFEAARTASQLNTAAGDIRAAGGDQTALGNLMSALRSEGVLSPGREGAAVSQGTNEQTKIQTAGVLYEAERTMLAAGEAARLSPNLTVVRPKDVIDNWRIGEGAWLPSQGVRAGWRTTPTSIVRGFDMNSYALTYLPDAYTPSVDGVGIAAYDATHGVGTRKFIEWWGKYRDLGRQSIATAAGLQNSYDIFLTSTDQNGGLIALWDPRRCKFLTPAEASQVVFAITNSHESPQQLREGMALHSRFVVRMLQALRRKTVFQPFPPAIRGAQNDAQRTAPAVVRGSVAVR